MTPLLVHIFFKTLQQIRLELNIYLLKREIAQNNKIFPSFSSQGASFIFSPRLTSRVLLELI